MRYDDSDILDFIREEYDVCELVSVLVEQANLSIDDVIEAFEDMILEHRTFFETNMDIDDESD